MAALMLALGACTGSDDEPPPEPLPSTIGEPTITAYGREGTFGALEAHTPSGQPIALAPVAGWGLPAGRQAYRAAVAADGTVLMAGRDTASILVSPRPPTSDTMVIGAFHPGTRAATTIPIRTTTGRSQVIDLSGRPAAPAVADLEPIGDAVAFVTQSLPTAAVAESDGEWPAFGVLTATDGEWGVAGGPGWANQWTDAELPGAGLAAGDAVEMARLPSGDIIITQRFPDPDDRRNGALLALRVTGPDAAGRYSVLLMGRYVYPEVAWPGAATQVKVSPLSVHADPTGRPGDERFAVMLQPEGAPQVLQEFRYNSGTGRITPVSAPILPGDRIGTEALLGFGPIRYDWQGNLWATRQHAFNGGSLAVYVADGTRLCSNDPDLPMGSYETSTDGLRAWGTTCRPDYDILQARAHLAPLGIVEDPQTHDIAVLHLGGTVLPIRPAGSGHELSFRIGDQVDLGQKLLPAPPSEGSLGDGRVAGVDEHGRLWISSMYTNLYADAGPVDHWLYAVHLPGLFEPAPVILPATPGESVTVQAEHTLTTSTRQRPGGSATVQVDSDAYLLTCLDLAAAVGCAYDGVAGNGFVVGDDSGYGHLSGPLEYRIEAPSAGQYRISYRVSTFAVTTDARIELSLGDRRRLTAVSTGGGWRTVEVAEAVTVPAGPQRLILSVPDGGGGWYLNSFRLQRV